MTAGFNKFKAGDVVEMIEPNSSHLQAGWGAGKLARVAYVSDENYVILESFPDSLGPRRMGCLTRRLRHAPGVPVQGELF